jgi:hypothetical protein
LTTPKPLIERLHPGPGAEARQEMAVTDASPPPSRWTLRTIRATFDIFRDLTLGGVWRALERSRAGLRSGVVQQYSPDLDYIPKRDNLYKCLSDSAAAPSRVVLVFGAMNALTGRVDFLDDYIRGRVNQFLDQFAVGSHALLRYVGLLGQGKLAQALRIPHDYRI